MLKKLLLISVLLINTVDASPFWTQRDQQTKEIEAIKEEMELLENKSKDKQLYYFSLLKVHYNARFFVEKAGNNEYRVCITLYENEDSVDCREASKDLEIEEVRAYNFNRGNFY